MRTESVIVYSDQSNAPVLQHPGRKFPGLLVQGDTLYAMCVQADEACAEASQGGTFEELEDLRSRLWDLLDHYKSVLGTHGIPLPFTDRDEK